ncbi:hypothetical protein [Planktosalinus lacus]|uniref:hypothetical protein n=1 Tax=Planktosalinus lacus TaxID=1526573 RepID=UPI00166F3D89|nr:hypothetical protein [Planktosalinus lacus]
MDSKSKEKGKRKRFNVNNRIISNWNKQLKVFKDKNPKLISEEMIFESENETPLFI